ncbi:site-specific integrase [Halobacillus sp. GSS1]|uniref:tyrosine-type recombinase/integrase n=1 Tax=Halobacillus sp. GSS1 TaxID=2815919 RepID=UPI001A8D7B76|nr:site-specific integrase [Halobacillus sp. GSS1]MBN9653885.1 site-specific integrase [Halobacillus sp. GSS1]
MTKRKDSLHVRQDLSDLKFVYPEVERTTTQPSRNHELTIIQALKSVLRQMEASGLRQRTLDDYERHITHFAKVIEVSNLSEVTANHIYEWLSSMNVSNQTKLTRLKCLKAFLSRCFDHGWITSNYWRNIRIKVDSPVKEGATDREIGVLLSLLDLTKFVQLRDAVAVLIMYQTGVRVGTLAQLREKHVDFESQTLELDGGILKNHQSIYLPFDGTLKKLLPVLLEQNKLIRKESKTNNDLLFITKNGQKVVTSPTNNNITKRLARYSKDYDLNNISPHALRRGFAKKLLDKGANVALISKALGHSDIAVTTRYLHLDKREVAESLRNYL